MVSGSEDRCNPFVAGPMVAFSVLDNVKTIKTVTPTVEHFFPPVDPTQQ